MENRELRLSYQEAIQLLRVGRYEEGLALLKAIDRQRPNVKNVLYPMAVCCEKLGYVEEGIDLCDQLIIAYGHETARAIKARLELSIPYPEAQEVAEEAEPEAGWEEHQEEAPLPVEEESLTSTLETPEESAPEAAVAVAAPPDGAEHRHKKPTWLVLLIALVAAAIVAGLIHVFLLQGSGW